MLNCMPTHLSKENQTKIVVDLNYMEFGLVIIQQKNCLHTVGLYMFLSSIRLGLRPFEIFMVGIK